MASYYDIYTKGGKIRRIYIPKTLRTKTEKWLQTLNRTSGYLFLNRFGERITTRGISQQLKNYAVKYGLNEKVVFLTLSAIAMPRISWRSSTTSHCLQTSWDMKA